MIETITVCGGIDKNGCAEKVRKLEMHQGQIYSVVGFTGSGKSQLISDIEQLAQDDSVTGRVILVNGKNPDYSLRFNPDVKLVAQLSQNMNFVLEMTVSEFLKMHAECRGMKVTGQLVEQVLVCVNTLAGEAVKAGDILTRLSGGQSRALMIADVAMVSNSPIILIDEIENAGIDRRKAMELLTGQGKIVLIVTHDPLLALLGGKRIVMENGGMNMVIDPGTEEKKVEEVLRFYSEKIFTAQSIIRSGQNLSVDDIEITTLEA